MPSPSLTHQAPLELFRKHPELVADVLRDILHVTVPTYATARTEPADLTNIELRPDLIVLLDAANKPVLGIVLESQLFPDEGKRRSWPAYAALLRVRYDCPACVLVITPKESIAAWARVPIEIGPGNVFMPLVLGPSAMPVIDDEDAARRTPALAVLSFIAHSHEPNAGAIARAALSATRGLSDAEIVLYSDIIFAALPEAARTALEELMTGNYEFQSEFAIKHQAKGREEGLQEGRAEGRQEGRAEGRQEGRQEGRAEALLAVLESRRLRISKNTRSRILACTDGTQLDAWLRKAASVASVDELFQTDSLSAR